MPEVRFQHIFTNLPDPTPSKSDQLHGLPPTLCERALESRSEALRNRVNKCGVYDAGYEHSWALLSMD